MERDDQILDTIHKKTRQRFLFASITLLLYGSFALCYTDAGSFLSKTTGDSSVSIGLLFFLGLIAIFLVMEYVFLLLNKDK